MPLRKCIALHLVMDVVHLAAVITQSDPCFTGEKKKKNKTVFFFRWDSSSLYPSYHCCLTVTERATWLPPASVTVRCAQCFQREITLQAPKENHCKGTVWFNTEFQLSCLIIPSGSRISSSCNHANPGPSKQKISWILHSLGATCRGWGDFA